jgi:hypothetical protein
LENPTGARERKPQQQPRKRPHWFVTAFDCAQEKLHSANKREEGANETGQKRSRAVR